VEAILKPLVASAADGAAAAAVSPAAVEFKTVTKQRSEQRKQKKQDKRAAGAGGDAAASTDGVVVSASSPAVITSASAPVGVASAESTSSVPSDAPSAASMPAEPPLVRRSSSKLGGGGKASPYTLAPISATALNGQALAAIASILSGATTVEHIVGLFDRFDLELMRAHIGQFIAPVSSKKGTTTAAPVWMGQAERIINEFLHIVRPRSVQELVDKLITFRKPTTTVLPEAKSAAAAASLPDSAINSGVPAPLLQSIAPALHDGLKTCKILLIRT